jgi:excisionase family DNA binding protein
MGGNATMKRNEPTRPDGASSPTPYLHTFTEAGRLLGGISERKVRRLIDQGELELATFGARSFRVSDESVRALIRRRIKKTGKPRAPANDDDVGGGDGECR